MISIQFFEFLCFYSVISELLQHDSGTQCRNLTNIENVSAATLITHISRLLHSRPAHTFVGAACCDIPFPQVFQLQSSHYFIHLSIVCHSLAFLRRAIVNVLRRRDSACVPHRTPITCTKKDIVWMASSIQQWSNATPLCFSCTQY